MSHCFYRNFVLNVVKLVFTVGKPVFDWDECCGKALFEKSCLFFFLERPKLMVMTHSMSSHPMGYTVPFQN